MIAAAEQGHNLEAWYQFALVLALAGMCLLLIYLGVTNHRREITEPDDELTSRQRCLRELDEIERWRPHHFLDRYNQQGEES